MYCFFITIFRLAIPAFFRFTDVTELMIQRLQPAGSSSTVFAVNLILYYWDILSRRSSRDPIFLLPSNHHAHRYYFMETPHWCFFAENCQQSLHNDARKLCETLCSLHKTLLGHDFSYCDLLHLVTRCYLHGLWIKPLAPQHLLHLSFQASSTLPNGFLRSPPPLPSLIFFLLLSQLSRRTSRGNACYAG